MDVPWEFSYYYNNGTAEKMGCFLFYKWEKTKGFYAISEITTGCLRTRWPSLNFWLARSFKSVGLWTLNVVLAKDLINDA